MITAEEARKLQPLISLEDRIRADIEQAITNVGRAGGTSTDVMRLIPNFAGWAAGRSKSPFLDKLKDDLVEAGYDVVISPGGAGARSCFRISW